MWANAVTSRDDLGGGRFSDVIGLKPGVFTRDRGVWIPAEGRRQLVPTVLSRLSVLRRAGSTPCSRLDWTRVGPTYWPDYLACILSSIQAINNDITSTFGSLAGTDKWAGGVLAPNGMIYGIPLNSTTVLKIDPTTDTASTFGNLVGSSKWVGGVLAPNGMIYGIPLISTAVLKIDPATPAVFTNAVLLSAYFNKF